MKNVFDNFRSSTNYNSFYDQCLSEQFWNIGIVGKWLNWKLKKIFIRIYCSLIYGANLAKAFSFLLPFDKFCSYECQNLMKTFWWRLMTDDVTLTSQLTMSYRKINIAGEKIINYRVSSPRNHCCCQINIIVRERPGILVIIHFFLFLRRHSKIFKLLKPV